MPQFPVADARRLVHTRTRFQPNRALPFVFKLDPALEHIDQLKLGDMQMRLARKLMPPSGADHTGRDTPLRGLIEPQITVLKKRAHTALELRIFGVRHHKTLRCHRHLLRDSLKSSEPSGLS